VAETHLRGEDKLHIPGYVWYGHNRLLIHRRAPCGSGGVGFLVKEKLLDIFNIRVLDDSCEGILWIVLNNKYTSFCLKACVCYLPPENSPRAVNAAAFFDNLLTGIYEQQNDPLFICGDLNSRCGDILDFIAGIDEVPHRDVIDFTKNKYGEPFCEFLRNGNCCMLNGRNYITNDFTCIRPQGSSVVDYCVVPYEMLHMFKNFEVTKSSDLITKAGLIGSVDVSRGVPDHSVLTWSMAIDNGPWASPAIHSYNGTDTTAQTFTKYDLSDIPDTFMSNEDILLALETAITTLECSSTVQNEIDSVYVEFCETVRAEMSKSLRSKRVVISSDINNRKRRIRKPWWNDYLSKLWNDVCYREREWLNARGVARAERKCELRKARKLFSKCVQRSKRQHWKRCQIELMEAVDSCPQSIWKKIGKIGVGAERHKSIPMQVVLENGDVSNDRSIVLDKWKRDFSTLLNPDCHMTGATTTDIPSTAADPVLDAPLTYTEFMYAIASAKAGKATGHDQIPVEVFTNEYLAGFLFRLCTVCFENGRIPEAWSRGIINPIPKNNMEDPRDPKSYRGITLTPAAYKLYCSIINTRLSTWIESNGTLADAQNGFRKNRSTIDHLGSLSSMIETRKRSKLSTYVAFVDFRKAYDCIDRELLWHKLRDIGVQGKMYRAITSLYKSVKGCVRLNGIQSDWFSVGSGLKQGCPLSPIMFNLFINDLARVLNEIGMGVDVDGERVCLLLYADDLVLLGESEKDLQVLLDALGLWCRDNKLTVNPDKSKVMHFRPESVARSCVSFTCGTCALTVTSSYTYLGLVFTEHLDYAVTAKHVAQAAGRALGLVIAKCKVMGGVPYNVFTSLYDAIVWPVISYGSSIWGTNEYTCVNAVQHRAARFYLGLGKYTPNAGVDGDIGWKSPFVKQMRTVANQWYRFKTMEASRLNRIVFEWAARKAGNRCKNWNFRVQSKLNSLGIDDSSLNVGKWSFSNMVENALMIEYIEKWKGLVNKQHPNSRPAGGNKLRRYSQFKTEFVVEPYVKHVLTVQHRSALAKFRCGVAPIRLETGRYEGLAVEERTCFNCIDKVEDEVHVLLQCPVYDGIRYEMIHEAIANRDDFEMLCDEAKINWLLSIDVMCKLVAKTCFDMLTYRRKLVYPS
jgi:hypothetical protein